MYNYTNSGLIKSNMAEKALELMTTSLKRAIRIYANMQESGRDMSNIAE